MRKFGITGVYCLAIIEKAGLEASGPYIDQKLAEVTEREQMPEGQTNVALSRLRARKLVTTFKGPHEIRRGKPKHYYKLTTKGQKTLNDIREFIG